MIGPPHRPTVYGDDGLASTLLRRSRPEAADEGSLAGLDVFEQACTRTDPSVRDLLGLAGQNDWEAAELLVNLAAGLGTAEQTKLAGAALVDLSRDLGTPPDLRDAIASFCLRVVERIQTQGPAPAEPWHPGKLSPELLYIAAQELHEANSSDGQLRVVEEWMAGILPIQAIENAQRSGQARAPEVVVKEALQPDRYVLVDEFKPAVKDSGLPMSIERNPYMARNAAEMEEALLSAIPEDEPVPIVVHQGNHWVLLVACKDQEGALACIAFDSLRDQRSEDDPQRRQNFFATALGELVSPGNFRYVNRPLQNLHPGARPSPLDNACGPLCSLALRGISSALKAPRSERTAEAIHRNLVKWLRQWESLGEAQQSRIVVAERAGMLASFRAPEAGA